MVHDSVRIARHIFRLISFRELHNPDPDAGHQHTRPRRFLHCGIKRPFCIHIKRLKFEIFFPCCILVDSVLCRDMVIEVTEDTGLCEVFAVDGHKPDPVRLEAVIQIDADRDTF